MVKVIKAAVTTGQQPKLIKLKKTEPPALEVKEEQEVDIADIQQIQKELMNEAKAEAKHIIEQAKQFAREKREQIEQEEATLQDKIAAKLEEARLKGYDEGFEIGRQDGEKSVQDTLEGARNIVVASQEDYMRKIKEAKPMILRIAVAVANKILGQTMKEQPDQWLHVVETAIKEVKEHEDVKVFVHPIRYETTLQQKRELIATLNGTADLYIYPNEELAETACMIETSFGKIDASIDSQLAEIKKHLLHVVEELENERTTIT